VLSRLLICWLIGLCCILGVTADTLVVAGRSQELPAPLITEGSEVLAPVVPALRLLGARASVKGNTVTIAAPIPGSEDRREVQLTLGSRDALAGGRKLTLPAAPRDVDGEIYLPVRALAPTLNADARYDAATRTLILHPLLSVTYEMRDDTCAILVHSAAPLQYSSGQLDAPPRTFYDFKHVALGMADQQMPVDEGIVQRIRVAQTGGDNDGTVRLAADLTGAADTTITMGEGGRLATILIKPKAAAPAATPAVPAPAAPSGAPVKLLDLTLTPQQDLPPQTELALTTDGPPLLTCDYDSKAKRLTLTIANGLNTLTAEQLRVPGDPVVAKIEAEGSATEPGTTLTVTLKQDAGYLIDRGPTGVRLLIGTFNIANMVIVLDAGHGGGDSGAISPSGTLEKDINLDVILRADKLLRAAGAQVLMSRSDDTFIPLDNRPALANGRHADLFVSVHCNSTPVPNSCSGTQTYYRTPQSAQFAGVIHAEMVRVLKLPNGGVRTANFLVIRKSLMPAVLIELGFINHSRDENLLTNPDFRQRCAEGIVSGIRRYAATRAWQLRRGERAGADAITITAGTPAATP
jgi:N-acetylmuramoyl-L-alanine amidase